MRANYEDNLSQYQRVKPSDLKIPERLLKVILKSSPEIKSMEVVDYEWYNMYDPMTFEAIPKYSVKVSLHFEWNGRLEGNTEYYADKINTALNMIFTDNDLIKFSVVELLIPKRNYHQEFYEFFT